jgi:hypothetical protein
VIDFMMILESNEQILRELIDLARATAEESDEARQVEEHMGELAADAAAFESPVWSGTLSRSHAVYVEPDATYVAIDPGIKNPFSPEDPHQYGPEIHAMGGLSRSGHRRDFYTATVEIHGQEIVESAADFYITTLEAIF